MASWTCPNCTLDNDDTDSCCLVCEHKRPNTKDTETRKTWKCDNCTLDNEESAIMCQTCGQHKASSDTNDNNTWTCNACTLQNPSSSLHCTMCKALNPNKQNDIQISYCWEWKGGNQWHEYPEEISSKIETAYSTGTITIDLDLSHAKYIIDLSKLQQINTSSNKTRKIQRVMYTYDPSSEHNHKNDKSDTMDMDIVTNDKCDKMDKNTQNNNKKDLMQLSSESEDENDVKMITVEHKPLKKKKTKKRNTARKGTLLGMFEKEKKEKIPSPIANIKLTKKKKRKLSDIDSDPIPKKKQKLNDNTNKIKISEKYSAKHTSDKEIGTVLNKDLIDALWELSMIERNAGNKFKANAYAKACKGLRMCGTKITSGKQSLKLNGVGKKIAGKIDELLSTGHLVKLDKLRKDDVVQGINELCQIHGIGPKKAAELVKIQKIFSIDALRDAVKKDKGLLNQQQKIGLKYFEYINTRIPRDECTKIGDIVSDVLKEIDGKIVMDICGSYRRGKPDCGDVDILLSHPDNKYDEKKHSKKLLADIVRKLRECGLLVEDLAHGPIKYMGICRYEEIVNGKNENGLPDDVPSDFKFDIPSFDDDGLMIVDDVEDTRNHNNDKEEANEEEERNVYFRRIDLKFINYKFYYANLLYFTGSDRFNVEMRLRANQKQFVLNENGIYKMLDEEDHTKKSKEPVVEPKCEKDIFDVIDMAYVEPKDRSW